MTLIDNPPPRATANVAAALRGASTLLDVAAAALGPDTAGDVSAVELWTLRGRVEDAAARAAYDPGAPTRCVTLRWEQP